MKNTKFSIYVAIISIILILSNSISVYTFNLFNYQIAYSVFTYALVFVFANEITRRYGYRKTLYAIVLADIIQFLLYIILNNIFSIDMGEVVIYSSILTFTIGQLINLFLYVKLVKNNRMASALFAFLVAITIDNIIFVYFTNSVLNADIWIPSIISIFIGLIIFEIFSKILNRAKIK